MLHRIYKSFLITIISDSWGPNGRINATLNSFALDFWRNAYQIVISTVPFQKYKSARRKSEISRAKPFQRSPLNPPLIWICKIVFVAAPARIKWFCGLSYCSNCLFVARGPITHIGAPRPGPAPNLIWGGTELTYLNLEFFELGSFGQKLVGNKGGGTHQI